jgi:alpha-ribazole phosphatase/probable phosphoglycerate mutase
MSVQLIYETHATTTDNERGIATGWLDGGLSLAGREQAAELGRRRANDHVDAIYVSDLGRAVETARIAFGMGFKLDARLRECDYGALNGTSAERVLRDRAQRIELPYPGGESYRDVVGRMERFLDDVRENHDGVRILVISHAAPRLALDHLVNGIPLEQLLAEPFEWQPGWEYVV